MGRIFFLLSFSAFSGIAEGHDLWLVSKQGAIAPGDRAKIFVVNGSTFPVSENPVVRDRIEASFLVSPGARRLSLTPAGEEGKATIFEPRFEEAGDWWATVATKPRLIELKAADFNEYLEHDGLPHVLHDRKAKGIEGRDEIEQYSKFAKVYIRIGDSSGENFRKPLGLRIEIVPEKNPLSLRVGDELPVQVLFECKPLSGFLVQAGFEGMAGNRFEALTDSEGRARIRISTHGHWYLRGIHMVEVEGKAHRYESFWASLTFRLQPSFPDPVR